MAKYSTVKCWSLTNAITDPEVITKSDPSLMLIKKSILKLGYRAFAVNERDEIEKQAWYPEFLQGEEVRFYIDGSGVYRLVNCDLTENELYFERLNIPIGYKPWVFYSWQSDFNPSRSAIKDALEEAIVYINGTLSPRQKLVVVESTRSEDGAKNIVDAIRTNLDKCMFAVFDITNIAPVPEEGPTVAFAKDTAAEAKVKAARTDVANVEPKLTVAEVKETKAEKKPKSYPNPNVVFELSYALANKRPNQILLAKQGRKDVLKSDEVPFDFAHNKRLDYQKPANLKAELREILIRYFRSVNYIEAE